MPARAPKPRHPTVVVIAGANGAGKSTAAPYLLKDALGILEFVNAVQIAVGLSAYAPETVAFEAGRVMLQRLRTLASARVSFAFESTLASRSFALFLARCKAHGYQVHIYYVALPSAELAAQRVALRTSPPSASSCASNWADTTSRPTTLPAAFSAACTTCLSCTCPWRTAGACLTTPQAR